MTGREQVAGFGRPRSPADGIPESTGAEVPSRSWPARLFLAGGFAVAAWALLTVLAGPAQASTGSAVSPGHAAHPVHLSLAALAHSRAGAHRASAQPAPAAEHGRRSTAPAPTSSAPAVTSDGHASTPAHAAAGTRAMSSLLSAAQSRRTSTTGASAAERQPAETIHSPTQHRGGTAAIAAGTTSTTSAGTTDRPPSPLAPRPEPAQPNAPAPVPTGGDAGHGHGAGGPPAAVLTGAELRAHPESVAVPLPTHPAAALDATDEPGSHPD